MDSSVLTNVAMGIALSACAGFRVFVPMLAASIAAHFNIIDLPSDLEWLGGWPAIICFGTAAIAEIGAFYIPFLDNILDTIATPLSIIAGTLLSFSIFPNTEQEPILRWVAALLAGGTAAGTIHLGTGLLRLFSSKTTAGTGNVVLATTENAAAISGSVLSFVIPIIAAVLVVVLIVWIIVKFVGRIFKNKTSQ